MHAATARGGRASIADSSALTVPSSAFTGRPSPSVIDFGSAKYARYSSHGTSAISSGALTGRAYGSVYGGVVPPPGPGVGLLPAVVPPSGPGEAEGLVGAGVVPVVAGASGLAAPGAGLV